MIQVKRITTREAQFEYLVSTDINVICCEEDEEYCQGLQLKHRDIEKIWHDRKLSTIHHLFNGSILNLSTIEATKESVSLFCFPIEYKHYLAQKSGIELGITPLAVSGITFCTTDNKTSLFFGKRSLQVTQYPGYYELTPSGSIDAINLVNGSAIDFTSQIITELQEELSIPRDEIKSHNTFCLIYDKPEGVFDIGVEIEINQTGKIEISNSEYTAIKRIPLNQVNSFLREERIVNTSEILLRAWSAIKT